MLDITKNGKVLKVSKGAFREIYLSRGWKALNDFNIPMEGSDYSKSELGALSSSEEDPIMNMSSMELKQYASLLGIDTRGLRSRENLIQAIRDHESKEN